MPMNKNNIKNNITDDIRAELLSLADSKYKKFISSLIPGCDNLIGVRLPLIKKIAKRIVKENADEYMLYLNNPDEIYFEEIMLKGFIIANMKQDIDVVLSQVKLFVPKITNWSLCDSFCGALKIVAKNKKQVWQFLKQYLRSNKTYEVRFAVVLLLTYFIEDDYIDRLFIIFDNIKHDDYYTKMAVAWALSICFIKHQDKTMSYLKNNSLDNTTYNKTLEKITQSLRVDKQSKEIIKSMKR